MQYYLDIILDLILAGLVSLMVSAGLIVLVAELAP
jgi:hypothetical protein